MISNFNNWNTYKLCFVTNLSKRYLQIVNKVIEYLYKKYAYF